MELKKLSPEAYQTLEELPTFSFHQHLPFLVQARKESLRGRSRILMHPNPGAKLHEMFVLYGKDTFIRANKHLGRDESLFVLEGSIEVIFFDDFGVITRVVSLGSQTLNHSSFILLPANEYHSVIINSPYALLLESTPGPFDSSVTVYADWSPSENEFEKQMEFRNQVKHFKEHSEATRNQVDKNKHKLVRESEKIFRLKTNKQIGVLDLNFLREILSDENLDRLRVCVHNDDSSDLQEMFMIFSKKTFINPSLHEDKDESLFIIEGHATYVFFDQEGNIIQRVPLATPSNELGRASYCRIPSGVIHALVVESDYVIVKETTSGPFRKESTRFPAWSPKPTRQEQIMQLNQSFLSN